jgi:hypothetical protein
MGFLATERGRIGYFARPTCLGSISMTHVKAGEKEEIELRLNSNYETVWRVLKERLDEPAVRLKSQYSTRLYLWAKQYSLVGNKRVSVGTLRKILGLEDVKDYSGRVVQDAPLELWANVKQRALDHALREINKQSDIQLELEFVGRGSFRKVLSLAFRITAGKKSRRQGNGLSLLPSEQCPNSWIRDQIAPCIQFDRCHDLGVIVLNEIIRASLATPSFGPPGTEPKSLFQLHRLTKPHGALPGGLPASACGSERQAHSAHR